MHILACAGMSVALHAQRGHDRHSVTQLLIRTSLATVSVSQHQTEHRFGKSVSNKYTCTNCTDLLDV